MRIILISIFFLSCGAFAQLPQELFFENISKADGLNFTTVRHIEIDDDEFVWFGFDRGLICHDGSRWIQFPKNINDSLALNDDRVLGIYSDPDFPYLWIGTVGGGVNRFNKETGEFIAYTGEGYPQRINELIKLNDGNFLVGTLFAGLFHFYPDENRYEEVFLKNTKGEEMHFPRVVALEKTDSFIWVGAFRVLSKLDLNGNVIDSYFGFFDPEVSNPNNAVKNIERWDDHRLLICGNQSIVLLDERTMEKRLLLNPEDWRGKSITDCTVDENKNIWFGTNGDGLYVYENESGFIKNYINSNNSAGSLLDDRVFKIKAMKDQPILWVGYPTGISKLDLTRVKIKNVNVFDIADIDAANIMIDFIYEDSDGNIWFNTIEGMFKYPKREKAKKYIFSNVPFRKRVNGAVEVDGKIYFASSIGCVAYDMVLDSFKLLDVDIAFENVVGNEIASIYKGEGDTIYLMNMSGVVAYSIDENRWQLHEFAADSLQGRFEGRALASDGKGNLWLGSFLGDLVCFNTKSKQFKYFRINQTLRGMVKTESINSLFMDIENNLWVGTLSQGLLKFNPKDHSFSNAYAIDQLASEVNAIQQDKRGDYWISTEYGFCRLNTETKKVTSFSASEGVSCARFGTNSVHKTSEGVLYYGGLNSFIYVQPEDIKRSAFSPPPLLSGIRFDSRIERRKRIIQGWGGIKPGKHLALNTSHEEVKIAVAYPSFSVAEKNRLSYRLEPHQQNWTTIMADEFIPLNSLKKGKHTLYVKGVNGDGVESEVVNLLDVRVEVNYLKSIFFWLILVLIFFVVFVIVLLVRDKLQRVLRQKLHQLVEIRTRDLSLANDELEESQEEILLQNKELAYHRNYLEEEVKLRTADLEKSKLQAEESDRLKTAFLANLSHEIRTPMNAIIGFSTLLNTPGFSSTETQEFSSMVLKNSEELLKLIDEMIDVSRIEANQVELIFKVIDVPELLHELFQSLWVNRPNEDLAFLLDIPDECKDFEFYSDPYRLKQILNNLIINAFKFTKQGFVKFGLVLETKESLARKNVEFSTIDWGDEGGVILFFVEDSGMGISEKDQEVVFQPFRKLSDDNSDVFRGIGLGLSIVKSLVVLLNGEMALFSEPGKGTKFYFYLPNNLF